LGAGSFGLLEAGQSVLRTDRSFAEPMSDYAVGRYGYVQTVAFVALAAGSAAVCAGLCSWGPRSQRWETSRLLIGTWSIGVSLAAAFRVDVNGSTSATGQVHEATSGLAFLAIIAAMWVFTAATRQSAAWKALTRLSYALSATASGAFVAAAVAQPSVAFGVAQRVFLGAIVVWLVTLGARLYALSHA
jgi:hypothetical protein